MNFKKVNRVSWDDITSDMHYDKLIAKLKAEKFTGILSINITYQRKSGVMTFKDGVRTCLTKYSPSVAWLHDIHLAYIAFEKDGKFHNPDKDTPAVTWYDSRGAIHSQLNYKNGELLGRVEG